ncbi:MAG TPA: hypothetical protein VMV10_27200 [Pirellulales bacterium]|nr:hypothetical protein [Pirellulales bacterium]
MNVTFACPRCGRSSAVELKTNDASLRCPHCQLEIEQPAGAFENGQLERCLVCPSNDLFVRKDFPQRVGVAIVVTGFAISCVTWNFYLTKLTFAVLFATAIIDFVLFAIVGESLTCYRCGAQYRGLEGLKNRQGFDLEIHERYRQEAARLAQRPAGAAKG